MRKFNEKNLCFFVDDAHYKLVSSYQPGEMQRQRRKQIGNRIKKVLRLAKQQ
jgi:hypothetical protein